MKKFGYQKWNWGVEYFKKDARKIKHFTDLDAAREYYENERKNLNSPVLFRFRPETFLEQLMRGEIRWMGYKMQMKMVAFLLVLSLVLLCWRHIS